MNTQAHMTIHAQHIHIHTHPPTHTHTHTHTHTNKNVKKYTNLSANNNKCTKVTTRFTTQEHSTLIHSFSTNHYSLPNASQATDIYTSKPVSALITTDVQHCKAKSVKCHTALADSSICFSRSISCRNWRISDTFASWKRKMCNKTTDWLCICRGYGHKTKERSYCSTN